MISRKRYGAMIIELAASIALLAIAMAALIEAMHLHVAAQRRITLRSRVQQEMANLMEQALALTWDNLTTDRTLQLVDKVESRMTDVDFTMQLIDEPEAPTARRIEVSATVNSDSSQTSTTMKLISWRYRDARDVDAEAAP